MRKLEALPKKFLETYLKTQPIPVVAVINHVRTKPEESDWRRICPINREMQQALLDVACTAHKTQRAIAPGLTSFLGFGFGVDFTPQ